MLMDCELCGEEVEYKSFPDVVGVRLGRSLYYCPFCGLYSYNSDFSLSTILESKPPFSNMRWSVDTPIYRRFLTCLRLMMWRDCIRRFQSEGRAPKFVSYPAVVTEKMIRDTVKEFRHLNVVDHIDNAIIAFAESEMGLFTGYIYAKQKRLATQHDCVTSKNVLMFRLIGIDTPMLVGRSDSPHPSGARGYTLFFDDLDIVYSQMIGEMVKQELIVISPPKNDIFAQNADYPRLTSKGWSRFNELSKSTLETSVAFMAMGFTGANEKAYQKIFQPAVEACGFTLETTYEKENHGSIIDDIELKIKRAPFVVADISGGNKGAYWEAGFAKALGKPVIYTCDDKTWKSDDKAIKPHFDIAHSKIIPWVDAPEEEIALKNEDAIKSIKAIIRNNVPGARLDD